MRDWQLLLLLLGLLSLGQFLLGLLENHCRTAIVLLALNNGSLTNTVTGMAITKGSLLSWFTKSLKTSLDLIQCSSAPGDRMPSLAKLGQLIEEMLAKMLSLPLPTKRDLASQTLTHVSPIIHTAPWSYQNCLRIRWGLYVFMLSPVSSFEGRSVSAITARRK